MTTAPDTDIRYHDRIAEDYFARWEQPIQRLTRRIESRWLRRHLAREPQPPQVLLAGSGGGRELEALLPLGADVCAVDYSTKALEAGRARWGDAVRWHHGDVHDLTALPERSFDVAVALSCFNWFVDPPRALASMISRVKPGGLVILSSLNGEHPTERNAKASRITRRPFSRDDLVAMACDQGLRDVHTRGLRVAIDRHRDVQDKPVGRLLIRAEPTLARVAGPRRCKWIWVTARVPR